MVVKRAGGRAAPLAGTIRGIYDAKHLALNAALAAAYYFLFTYSVAAQNHGAVVITVNPLAIYLLVATSSVMMTLTAHSLEGRLRATATTGYVPGAVGLATLAAGSAVVSCACSIPILFSLTSIGLGVSEIFAMENFISANIYLLMGTMIAINAFVVMYYLHRESDKRRTRLRKNDM